MAIFVKIDGLRGDGDVTVAGYAQGDWFIADSFSFGVERSMESTGAKGGTMDINIGVGELKAISLAKSTDRVSPKLAQFAINGNSLGVAQIDFTESSRDAGGKTVCYLRYKLDRCFVKSWSTSGSSDDRPVEEVELVAQRIAYTSAGQQHVLSWDASANKTWTGHGLTPLCALGRV